MAPSPSTPTPPDLHAVSYKFFAPEPDDELRPQKPTRRDRDRSPEAELQRWLDLSG